jgi:hypothetical protein
VLVSTRCNQFPYHFLLYVAFRQADSRTTLLQFCVNGSGGGKRKQDCTCNIIEGEIVEHLKGDLEKKHTKKGNEPLLC